MNRLCCPRVRNPPVASLVDISLSDDEALLDDIERTAFSYFRQVVNPANGLVADNTRDGSPCSIAVVEFALSVYPIGVERGWMARRNSATPSCVQISGTRAVSIPV